MTSSLPTVPLGDGFTVSAQGYGAMSLTDAYGPVSDEQALAVLHHAFDRGVTFIDTANIYGKGRSETIIAKLIASHREEVQLATKFGIVSGGGVGARSIRGDRAHVREQIDLSLQRLGTDYVDLYYQHRVDPNVPIEETVGAVAELVDEGKVRHIGLSEATGEEIRRAASVHPITAVQSEWSIVSRDVETHVFGALRDLGIGFVPYASVGRQWLTGTLPDSFVEPDIRRNFPRLTDDALAANAPLLQTVLTIATELEVTGAQIALAWSYHKAAELGIAVSPIPGTRFESHVDDNLGALDVKLSEDQLERLEPLADRVVGHRSAQPEWVSSARE